MRKTPRFISPALNFYPKHPGGVPTAPSPSPPGCLTGLPSVTCPNPNHGPSLPQTCSTCSLSVLVTGNSTLSPSPLDSLLNQAASGILLKQKSNDLTSLYSKPSNEFSSRSEYKSNSGQWPIRLSARSQQTLGAKSCQLPVSVNKVLLQHRHTYSFLYGIVYAASAQQATRQR